jgi:hypothetical protein
MLGTRHNKIALAIIAVTAMVLTITSVCYAYVVQNPNYGYYSSNIGINTSQLASAYTTPASNAKSAWNSAGTPCAVYYSVAYLNTMLTGYYGSGFYGYYVPLTTNSAYSHLTTKFALYLNQSTMDSLSSAGKKDVVMHELGHAMGLGDLTSGTALMNYNRLPGSLSAPQADDINGVNASW